MTPINQSLMHDPENGVYGDCMRACVASLLDLPLEAVPHFYEGGCGSQVFFQRVADFLKGRNLVEVSFPAAVWGSCHFTRDCYHLIYGHTVRGTYHAVVGLNGVMIHDPHPSKVGLLEDRGTRFALLVSTGATLRAAGYPKEP